jgi:hypothetical protein
MFIDIPVLNYQIVILLINKKYFLGGNLAGYEIFGQILRKFGSVVFFEKWYSVAW